MIKAYLTWITTLLEGDDVEIRYKVFKDEELVKDESFFKGYAKPALCGLVATEELLKDLKDYREENIKLIINDGALFDILKGTSQTPNKEIQSLGRRVRKKLDKFTNFQIENTRGDHLATEKWHDILTPDNLK